ncbi:MAG TPA: VOC family protein [Blastocatellia bacterium]|jgi:catechol 2,3-dioxygenase-like lactoylglutathione lyase family enzyme
MNTLIKNASFHHIEVPCHDLELAERFYVIVFGARVYMRRDARRRPGVPLGGTIAEAEENGFEIDGTYMRIGDGIRIGFLKNQQEHNQREMDHLAFTVDDEDLAALWRRLTEVSVEVIEHNADRMIIRDPFGMMLELWPRSVLDRMGLL